MTTDKPIVMDCSLDTGCFTVYRSVYVKRFVGSIFKNMLQCLRFLLNSGDFISAIPFKQKDRPNKMTPCKPEYDIKLMNHPRKNSQELRASTMNTSFDNLNTFSSLLLQKNVK